MAQIHETPASEIAVSDEKNEKHEAEEIEVSKAVAPQMRLKSDNLGIWDSVKQYKLISAVAMAAAFAASLDGYQISLNGGIVSNKGFIRQMANPGTKIIDGKYVSAWGGIQSAGQTIGQIVRRFHSSL